ncbi:MAG TPA: porin family protein [Candidatus Polarisedimenticolia bacterium]|nr:porin family protein [Candidatus Polarisedimenticolia bacterium]
MKRMFCLAVVVLSVIAVPSFAANAKGSAELGFDYGNTQLDSNTGFDSASSLAVRGGYFFNPMFEVEGQIAHTSQDTTSAGVNVDGKSRLYMVNGVFNFYPKDELTPYVMAGVGVADNQVEALGQTVSDSSVAYQVGAGSRFYFGKSKRTAFRVDVSLVNESTFDQSSTHTNYSGGFTWKIGSGH